jgi:ParB-like nuclease domain
MSFDFQSPYFSTLLIICHSWNAMQKIELVDPKDLLAWDKNPRERDPERFEWLQMSLRKFGFVMPVFVRQTDGLLYSGHQRTGAAVAIGFSRVPVVTIPSPGEELERSVNILFNLCTNDHATKADFGAKAALDLDSLSQFESLPDTSDRYPCLQQYAVEPSTFLPQLTPDRVSMATVGFADHLHDLGIQIPVVLDEDGMIVNGGARLMSAIAKGIVAYPAVRVVENADALKLFLNKITMSFDLKKAFGEELRYNSFFRQNSQTIHRTILGVGFFQWVFGAEARQGGNPWLMKNLTVLEGDNLRRWKEEHGTVVIDFGAGRLDNTRKLQAVGITCIPFEPYCMKPGKDEITLTGARAIARRFLFWLKSRPHIDSLFCSSVFNSVPFKQDRDYLMVIFQAICMHGSRLYLHTLSDTQLASQVFNNGLNATTRKDNAILLDSEPGVYIMRVMTDNAKVQKFHNKEELIAMGHEFFHRVKYYSANGSSHGIKCEGSKTIDWRELVKALEFEFDLPYPGDRRLGLVELAIECFSSFTGQDLFAMQTELHLQE